MEIATVSYARVIDPSRKIAQGGPPFQAIPLYTPSDTAVADYIRDHQKELNDLSGAHLLVVLIDALRQGDTGWLETVFAPNRVSPRYPSLKLTDLPCLWFEDGQGGHVVIRLSKSEFTITDILRGVVEACKGSATAAEVRQKFNAWVAEAGLDRSVIAREIKDYRMSKSTERLIATICGVVFVAVMLAIAVFIPSPTGFQTDFFRIVLSLAAAGFVSMVPGFLNVEFGGWAKAGGALAVFLVVYLVNPASRAADAPPAEPAAAVETG